MACPSSAELLKMAFGEVSPDDAAVRHAHSCAACAREVNRWREVAALLQLADVNETPAAGCIDEMTIAAVATGNTTPLTSAVKTHLAECAECRTQLAGAIETLRAPEIIEEIDRLDRGGVVRRRAMPAWTRVAALAAVLAGLMLVPQIFRTSDNDSVSRTRELRDTDPTITKTVAPRIVAPVGSVSRVEALTWTSVPGATRYGVRLFAHEGTVVWETETNDTTIALPSTVELTPGSIYLYQVDARTSFDRSAQSELTEFRINLPER